MMKSNPKIFLFEIHYHLYYARVVLAYFFIIGNKFSFHLSFITQKTLPFLPARSFFPNAHITELEFPIKEDSSIFIERRIFYKGSKAKGLLSHCK